MLVLRLLPRPLPRLLPIGEGVLSFAPVRQRQQMQRREPEPEPEPNRLELSNARGGMHPGAHGRARGRGESAPSRQRGTMMADDGEGEGPLAGVKVLDLTRFQVRARTAHSRTPPHPTFPPPTPPAVVGPERPLRHALPRRLRLHGGQDRGDAGRRDARPGEGAGQLQLRAGRVQPLEALPHPRPVRTPLRPPPARPAPTAEP